MINPYSNEAALIILNGSDPFETFDMDQISSYSFRLAVDGALDRLLAHGIHPEAVTGDFDSVSQSALEEYRVSGGRVLHDADQNSTDYEKALKFCVNNEIHNVDIIGYHGSRLDQMLAVFGVALKYENRIHQQFFDPVAMTRVLLGEDRGGRRLELTNLEHHVCSIIPLMPCKRVSLEGFKWPLYKTDMAMDGMVSSSNEVVYPFAGIQVDMGALLVILHHKPGQAP